MNYVIFLPRLEQLAQDIESEYEKFDSWREHCENMNQWLIESERLIRNEEKVGAEVAVLQEQISDNRVSVFGVLQCNRPPRAGDVNPITNCGWSLDGALQPAKKKFTRHWGQLVSQPQNALGTNEY